MSLRMTKEELMNEIDKRKPWFQKIVFPDHGVSTTDRPEWALRDSAHDNLFPGVDPAEAALLRPYPKWERIKPLLPDVKGKTLLEVGTSCGFFIFEFCRLGVKHATGIELDTRNVERAQFCATVLNLKNAEFVAEDLGNYNQAHDIVLLTSVHEHFLFPYYYLARVLCLATETLLLDTHHYIKDDPESITRLDLSYSNEGKAGSHGFHFSRRMFMDFFGMIGISPADIQEKVYYEDTVVRRLLICVDTKRFQKDRLSNVYLQQLKDVGV